MTIFQSILLGLLQGFTEFLPISSSGHLVILQDFMRVNTPGVTFEVLLHFGTLLAVIVYFRKDIMHLLLHPRDRMLWLLVAGVIPTALLGVFFEDLFEQLFSSVSAAASMLLVTGLILWIAESMGKRTKSAGEMTFKDALIIGIAQGLAITPGISRSGTTISAALLVGLDRDAAARYSFLVVIPVILGATLLKVDEMLSGGIDVSLLSFYLIGTLVAAVSGYFAIMLLLKVLHSGRLKIFSIYCWLLGITVLLLT